MRVAFLVLALIGCQKEARIEAEHEAAAVEPPASVVATPSESVAPPAAPAATASALASVVASASASPPAPRIPCGTTTCAATQYCIRMTRGQGIAPPPGQNPVVSTSSQCANALPLHGGGMVCTAPDKNRQVSCQALIPSMAPRQ